MYHLVDKYRPKAEVLMDAANTVALVSSDRAIGQDGSGRVARLIINLLLTCQPK
jgi:hypothetical protein